MFVNLYLHWAQGCIFSGFVQFRRMYQTKRKGKNSVLETKKGKRKYFFRYFQQKPKKIDGTDFLNSELYEVFTRKPVSL